jgi:tripartite-type tricarboxylate transporter receptor subunit TctC
MPPLATVDNEQRAKEDVMRTQACALAALLLAAAAVSPAGAQSAADFYRGKTIRVIVGSSAGDYDTWARVVARHMRQHIPGNPNFIVENMPGAGSLIAANYLYNKAAQDGTVLGSVSRNIPNFAFMKHANASFDPLKFNWIGSPEMTHRACYARADSGVTAPEHLFEREVLMGTDGAGTSLSEMPVLLRNLLGMKFKTVDGYKGSTEIVLAMQRNEVQGICQTVMAFANSGQHLLDDGTVRMLFTTEKDRVPVYEGKVPTVFEYAKTEEHRNILAFHASSLETGRPWLAPPNVPADRVQALRRAYDATMKDRGFLEEAKQRKLEVDPRTGEYVEGVLRAVGSLPEELMAKAAQMTRK